MRQWAAGLAVVLSTSSVALRVWAGPVMDCPTPNNDGIGYGQYLWTGMTADLDTANGGALTTTTDLSNLQNLLTSTGLWVDVRQPQIGTLTATETSNLQAYIATGRRVVLLGGLGPQPGIDSNYSSWNDAIMTAVGGPTGATYFRSASTPAYLTSPINAGVSNLDVPAGAVASSGTTLFADRVATVWGPARNVIVLLGSVSLSDDYLTSDSNGTFAGNLASWVAGAMTDGACQWESSTGGSWTDGPVWQLSERPNVGDDAVFNLGSAGYTVTVPAAMTARNLIVQNDHVTINLSTASSNLTLLQTIAVEQSGGQTASGSLTVTNSLGGSAPAVIAASSISLGGSGSGTLSVGAGVQVNVTGATTIASGSSLVLNGGTLDTGTIASAGSVSVTSGTIHIAAASLRGTLNKFATLTLDSGHQLDLARTDMDVQSGDLAGITNLIRIGYAAGSWTGAGITSSAAAADPSHLTALGVILNNDGTGHAIFGSGTTLGLFDGTSPGIGDVLVKYTFYGDANLDGRVDGSDYSLIDNGFNHHGSLTGWYNGDFNYDGTIDGSDYTLIDNAFNSQGSALGSSTAQIAGSSSVPEPATLGWSLVMGAASFARRRRRGS